MNVHTSPPALPRLNLDTAQSVNVGSLGSLPKVPSRVALELLLSEWHKNLDTAAQCGHSIYGTGNGKYRANRSSLKELNEFLETHTTVSKQDIETIQRLIEQLSPDKHTKYRGPLRGLIRLCRNAFCRLIGPYSRASQRRRNAILDKALYGHIAPDQLSPSESVAIQLYKMPGGSDEINSGLRGDTYFSLDHHHWANLLIDALNKRPPSSAPLYRGSSCLMGGKTVATIGDVCREPGFISTSLCPEGAFSSRFQIKILPSRNFRNVVGVANQNDNIATNLDAFEQEAIGLPNTLLEYCGFKDGFHVYREVSRVSLQAASDKNNTQQ